MDLEFKEMQSIYKSGAQIVQFEVFQERLFLIFDSYSELSLIELSEEGWIVSRKIQIESILDISIS